MSSSATVIATVPKSAAICSSAPGRATHSRPNAIARPEVPLLPGHEGAAPQRAVGDDRRRHEQVHRRIRPRRTGQAPAGAKPPGDLQERAGALAARVLEARGLVDRSTCRRSGDRRRNRQARRPATARDRRRSPSPRVRPRSRAAPAGVRGCRRERRREDAPRCGQDAISGGHTVVATSFGATTRAWRRCPSRISSAIAVSAAAPLPAPKGAIRNAASCS